MMWYGSPMTADENIKIWAAAKTGLEADAITDITFERGSGYRHSEYTYEPGYIYAEVWAGRKTAEIPLSGVSFMDIIKEIYEAGETAP